MTSAPSKPTTRQGSASSHRSIWAGCPSLSALANPVAIFCIPSGYIGVCGRELRVNSCLEDVKAPDEIVVAERAGGRGRKVVGDPLAGDGSVEARADGPRPDLREDQ